MAPCQQDPKSCCANGDQPTAAAKLTSDHNSPQSSAQDTRKVHKADREKLRRDKLNEQFAELASVLDPHKPKHDKATILGDSLQIVKDLRNEIRRLRTERGTLFDESKELKRERDDLEEEKTSLFKQTNELGQRMQQCIQATMSFASTTADETTPQPIGPQVSSIRSQVQVQVQPTLPPPYSMYNNPSFHFRPQTVANPFVYLTSPSVPHVERPCAQYATPDAVPDFLGKVQSSRGFQPLVHKPQATSLDDDSDVQLQLGQPRNQVHHEVVDTNLQLKVPD